MGIQLRRDTAANWTSANPVLAAGQPGYETDTRKLKVGDGSTAWNSLSYIDPGSASAAWGSITGTLSSQTDLQTALDGKAPTTHIGATGSAHGNASTSVAGFMSAADKTKLDGVAAGATANGTDAFLLNRANHTGTQAAATITGLATVATSGSAADLGTGSLPAGRLPAFTGDVTTTAGTVSTTIANGAVSLAKMANLAANSIIGNNTGSSAAPTALTAAQVRTLLNVADGATANAGTVTSVSGAGTVSGLTLSGSVTTSGSLTLGGTLSVTPSNFASQTANTFLAAPNGAAGTPTFRAIVAADIPTLNQNTTGSAATLTTSRNFSISGGGITAAAVGFNGSAAVTLSASVDAGHITLARMANLAANSFIGNNTGTAATPLALSGTQATALLDTFSSTLKGLAPASGGGTTNFLRADGTWAAPPGGSGGTPGGSSGEIQFNNAGAFGGAVGLNWDSVNGTIGVGRAAAGNVRAFFRGGSTGSGAFSIYAENSAATAIFGTRDDGAIFTGQTTNSPLNLTTASLPNVVVGADGYLYRSTATLSGAPGGSTGQIQFNNAGAFSGDADLTWDSTNNTLGLNGKVELTALGAEPSAPAAGDGYLYARDIAGRVVPKWIGPSGVDYPLQPHIGVNNVRVWRGGATTTATTFASTIGTLPYTGASPTAPTIPALAATNLLTQTVRSTISTGATAGGLAYIRGNQLTFWRGNAAGRGGFNVIIRFALSGTLQAGLRCFAGIVDVAANPTNIDPTTTTAPGGIGLAINTNSGNWNIVNNATGTARTSTGLGASFPVNNTDLMELVLFCAPNGSAIGYRVTNWSTGAQTSGSLSSNIPANTTFLAPSVWITNNATAAAQTLDFISVYVETDY